MNYYGQSVCTCRHNGGAGCICRYSIDNVTGRPIVVADYTIPVYKGSTLTTEFQFPFNLQDSDTIDVVQANPEILADVEIARIGNDLIVIKWDADIISQLITATTTVTNSFRIRVTNSNTGIVKVYNDIKILPV